MISGTGHKIVNRVAMCALAIKTFNRTIRGSAKLFILGTSLSCFCCLHKSEASNIEDYCMNTLQNAGLIVVLSISTLSLLSLVEHNKFIKYSKSIVREMMARYTLAFNTKLNSTTQNHEELIEPYKSQEAMLKYLQTHLKKSPLVDKNKLSREEAILLISSLLSDNKIEFIQNFISAGVPWKDVIQTHKLYGDCSWNVPKKPLPLTWLATRAVLKYYPDNEKLPLIRRLITDKSHEHLERRLSLLKLS